MVWASVGVGVPGSVDPELYIDRNIKSGGQTIIIACHHYIVYLRNSYVELTNNKPEQL